MKFVSIHIYVTIHLYGFFVCLFLCCYFLFIYLFVFSPTFSTKVFIYRSATLLQPHAHCWVGLSRAQIRATTVGHRISGDVLAVSLAHIESFGFMGSRHPYIGLVLPHPMDPWLDWDLGSLEARSKPRAGPIPGQFLQCRWPYCPIRGGGGGLLAGRSGICLVCS